MNIPYWAEWRGRRHIVLHEFNVYARLTDGLSLPVVPLGDITPLPECTGWDWKPPLNPAPRLREATVEDAIRALRGEEVACLCRDDDSDPFRACFISSYCEDLTFQWRARGQLDGSTAGYHQCFVEDTK